MFEHLLHGFSIIFTSFNFGLIIIGTVLGVFNGMTPGLGVTTGVALALPFTFGMPPETALMFLCAVYMASQYGGSISAILINTPGTGAAVATVFDGYPMALKGEAGKALSISAIASSIGGLLGVIILIFLSVPLSMAALRFNAPEYTDLGILGLAVIIVLIKEDVIKGLISAVLGLLISTVGVDVFTGQARFTLGSYYLYNGIPLVPAMIGLFALSEMFKMTEELLIKSKIVDHFSSELISLKELKKIMPTIFRSSGLGTLIGILPGAGATIGALISYSYAKNRSKTPEEFGKGCIEGVAAPEAANNASVGGALVPLLTLGIPGSAATAILVGALTMHGITPGPQLFEKNLNVVYGLFASLIVVCFLQMAVGLSGAKLFPKLISIRKSILLPAILAIIVMGTFSLNATIFDVWVMFIFGLLGYVFQRIRIPSAPMVLAIILGYIIESNFRRSLVLGDGSLLIFFTRPITVFIMIASVFFVVWSIRKIKKPGLLNK